MPEIALSTALQPSPHALGYRPDIDGLRAVAVLAVVLYHAWPAWIPGGFIGVDIFFVISGYLISVIIMSQLVSGSFSLADFYARRVRRIFPALLLVMLATAVFGWTVLLQGEFRQLGRHTAAGSGFVSNLVLWQEAGYFDNAATTKPLLHLWSLGVEEQFYLLWPLILWLVFRRHFNFLLVTALIFCASMALNLATVQGDPTSAFYSPATRFWELMSGGIAAYLQLHHAPWSTRLQRWASWGGGALLALGFALIKAQLPFPGWWAVLPVSGAFLLIMAGPAAPLNARLLGARPAVWIGLISYPLYLWHWPLLAYGFIVYGEKPSYSVKLALVGAAFVLATLTYRMLELPLRRVANKRAVVQQLAIGMVAMVSLGGLAASGLLRERINAHGADVFVNALNDSAYPGPAFTPLRHQNIVFQQVPGRGAGLTVFLGDSVVQHYGPYIEQALTAPQAHTSSVIFATAGGCPPIPHTVKLPRVQYPLCPATVEAAYDLARSARTDTVVIGAAWQGYFAADNQLLLYNDGQRQASFPGRDAMELAYQSLEDGLRSLHGKRLFLVLQPPSGNAYDPRNMYAGSRFDSIHPRAVIPELDYARYLRDNAAVRTRLQQIAARTGAQVIDPGATLCHDGVCPVRDSDGRPLYTDGIHMRPFYSRRAATFLAPALVPPAAAVAATAP
nr:acyltransferase family protein [Duganella flavida]